MPEQILYTADVTARGGREGRVKSADGALDLPLAVPKGMGGSGGDKANPELLFAAGYAACFEGAIRLAAKNAGVTLGPDTNVRAQVGIGPRKAGGFELTVDLQAHVDGVDKAQAQKLVDEAHQNICPYSHATRGNVEVKTTAV